MHMNDGECSALPGSRLARTLQSSRPIQPPLDRSIQLSGGVSLERSVHTRQMRRVRFR